MSNIVGIDLGTTMSAIAKLNSIAKPEIVPNSEGERMTPSVVFFKEYDDSILVGTGAKNSASSEPKRVAKEFKRKMDDDNYRFNVDNKGYSAIELSAMVLKKLVSDASKTIGEIKDVVISVPAYFKENQRNATIKAGRLAGLNVIAIINEPTAAALYYANNNKSCKKVLVYDLGGGTFDVTILSIDNENVEIITSSGDARLGGVDFDHAILEILQAKYTQDCGKALFNDDSSKEEFLLLSEEIKKKLSNQEIVKQKLRGDGGSAIVEISRKEFEDKISNYISRTELLVETCFDGANLKPEDIDEVLLVGGSTRIPAIVKSISNLTHKTPKTSVNVDEAVALGAAIKAGLVTLETKPNVLSPAVKSELSNMSVVDVANHSYGTISLSGDSITKQLVEVNNILIEKNSKLPCSITKTFYTACDGQTTIELTITQGEDEDPDFVDKIHKDTMELPPNRPAGQPVEVTYEYDENQIMHCTFLDVNSKVSKKIDLHMGGNDKEIDLNIF